MGPAGAILRGHHRRMARWAARVRHAVDTQLSERKRRQRPAVLAVRIRSYRGAAVADLRPVVPHPAHQPRRGLSATRACRGLATCAVGIVPGAAGREPGRGRPFPGSGSARTRLVLPVLAAADVRHLGRRRVGVRDWRDLAPVRPAGPAAWCCLTGRRGAPGQLQRLPPLLRGLPLRRHRHGAASGWNPGPATRPGDSRSLRKLRHLRRLLPVVYPFPQRGRTGYRHRHAANADRRAQTRPGTGTGAARGRKRDCRVRLRSGRECGEPARQGPCKLQPDLHRHAAALLRRIRAARRSRGRAGDRLPRGRLRLPPGQSLDRGASRRNA